MIKAKRVTVLVPTLLVLCFIFLAAGKPAIAQSTAKRSSYSIPLARLSVFFDEETRQFDKVKVSFGEGNGDDDNYFQIADGIDYEIKITRDGRQKFVHGEAPDKSYMMSDFEAEVMNRVVKTFIQQLEIYERDLQNEKWDRLLYLDAYFPRFLKGFYYLYCAARSSQYALPKGICIADSLYDISLTSPKSDKRIDQWKSRKDMVIKLRIVSKELIYQMREWQKKELDNPRRNKEISYGKKFEEAFTLFMRIYFGLLPIPDVPPEGQHL